MSYAVTITRPDGKNYQIFGNHDYPNKLNKYLKKYNCNFEYENVFYDFEIVNFDEFFGVVESYIQTNLKQSYTPFFNSRNRYDNNINYNIKSRNRNDLDYICKRPITSSMISFFESSYACLGIQLLFFLEDYLDGGTNKAFYNLRFGKPIKLKKDCKLFLSGS